MLVELVRAHGDSALAASYSCVVVDEMHERSVEQDLTLALVRGALARSKTLRVVLMSASADNRRAAAFFDRPDDDVGVQTIVVPDTLPPATGLHVTHARHAFFLGDALKLLGREPAELDACFPSAAPDSIHTPDVVHGLLCDLVEFFLDRTSPEGVFLVFLPTFRSLEQQHDLLVRRCGGRLAVHALHSSVDVETLAAVLALAPPDGRRKVLLATNVAESSLTIPNVALVLDSCQSLAVVWDRAAGRDAPTPRWASKSAALQRAGRTGRTCTGRVYRLVPRRLFDALPAYDTPASACASVCVA